MTSKAKNYAGQNLRGRSFKGENLSGSEIFKMRLKQWQSKIP
ncbi:MAG: hypothetical protein ACK596_16820 [Pseudanabaena sp.]